MIIKLDKIIKAFTTSKSEDLEKPDIEILKSYQKEWEKSMDVQMHFNTLTIQLRTRILTIFITVLGGIIGYLNFLKIDISKIKDTSNLNIKVLLSLPLSFLIIGFLIDVFYYSKLLTAAVKFNRKFDESLYNTQYNLFGITRFISNEVPAWHFYIIIVSLYIFPIIIYSSFLWCLF